MRAVLCLGPKRSGQPYKPREEVMLRILARTLALRFAVIAPEEIGDGRFAGQASGGNRARPPASGPLSACEMVVLAYLAQGLSNQDIATRANRSVKTIQIHIAHIYEKLGVHSRTRALHVARQRHLLTADDDRASVHRPHRVVPWLHRQRCHDDGAPRGHDRVPTGSRRSHKIRAQRRHGARKSGAPCRRWWRAHGTGCRRPAALRRR